MSERMIVRVELELTQAQRIALEDMLATWNQLGGQGASRWTAFYADGDGNFQPRATIDERTPQLTTLVPRDKFWKGDEYRIDFDTIGWALHAKR